MIGIKFFDKIRVKSNKKFFQRATLVFLCSVMTLTIAMPNEVMAINLFNWKPAPKTPSVLQAQKVDITKTQAVGEAPAGEPFEFAKKKEDRTLDYEITSKRTPFTSTYVNKDGTKTLSYTPTQQNYKQGNTWQKINNKLDAIEKSAPAKTILDTLMNTTPAAEKPTEFKGKAGVVSTEMNPLSEGLSLDANGKKLTIKPVGANNVAPQRKDDRTVVYVNAWPNVDLEYELRGELVKEIIVIKDKKAQTSFNFEVSGGKVVPHPTRAGELTIEGMPEEFGFSTLSLDVNKQGVISEQRVTQSASKNGIKIDMDKEWFKTEPSTSFPMRIDPSFGRNATSWWMFKSDGYSCGANTCYANTGTLYNNGWKHWRTYMQFPYPELAGKRILNANLHGWFKGGIGGDQNGRGIWMGHANCISFNCRGGLVGSTGAATDFDINFTGEMNNVVTYGDMGAVWSIWGEEGPYTSYKPYVDMRADIIYDTPTPMANPAEPAAGQVTIDTQPTLKVGAVGDADGDAVKYYFRVATSADAETGAVINSGWINENQWTIPEGILQDGTTYYWHVYTLGATQTNPNWVRSFKVDLRTGKNSTQSYDSVGAVGIDLATGNSTTSNGTHNMNALGGKIGLNLSYDNPATAKKGLTAEYWNVAANYPGGAPSTPANLVRTDQNVNFNWSTGSPSPGHINNDWFYARWKGYFVAPTTGSYTFGSAVDDATDVYINEQKVYGRGCCGANIDYTGSTPVTLQAGQVVPIRIQYLEAIGAAYARVYVKGPVPEQVIPRDWLRTELKPSVSQYGLNGRYYTDDGSHNFPTDPNNPSRLLTARNDSKLAFNWGDGGPAPGLQVDNFMVKWTGYITVPGLGGSYTFGKVSDDGVRVKVNNGTLGTETMPLDSWSYTAGEVWGSAANLPGGQQIPITVEYYEANYGANFTLKMKGPGLASAGEDVPVKWLTPKAVALPDSWRLGVDVDGGVAYERLRFVGQNVVLEDSTRSAHEYTWTGSAYKPPLNENGLLTRNPDNTFTMLDVDGRTYVFDAEGKLRSVTAPTDDRSPASLRYVYGGEPSRLKHIVDGATVAANADLSNLAALPNARYGTLNYKGVNEDGNCSVPNGYEAAPDGMLCAFKTTDGEVTKLYYKAGQLSRIEKPGGDLNDYGYDEFGRITTIRDTLANDAIAANIRADDSSVLTEVTYDPLGRVGSVKAPSATATASRLNHTFDYQPGKVVAFNRFYQPSGPTTHITSTASTWPTSSEIWTMLYGLSEAQSGTRPIYLCQRPDARYFTGTDINCYGYGNANRATIGHLFTQPTGQATVPLSRIRYSDGYVMDYPSLGEPGWTTEEVLGYGYPSQVSGGSTLMRVTGASEPNGFSKRVEYDSQLRTIKETDVLGLTSTQEWDPVKNLKLSATDAVGLKSTTIYDKEDRVVEGYGPAPAAWFGSDRKPLTAPVNYTSQVARTQTKYDENIFGPAVTWYNYKAGQNTSGAPGSGGSLVGAPRFYATGINTNPGILSADTAAPAIPYDGNYTGVGFRGTGKLYMPNGKYWINAQATGGIRVWVDDQIIIDSWQDAGNRGIAGGSFTVANNDVKRFRLETYRKNGSTGPFSMSIKQDYGFDWTNNWSQWLKPDYNLTTSETAFDAQLGGALTTKTTYNKPEYGLVDKATVDASDATTGYTGLNLEATATYESPGTGLLRQTSKTLPGGGTISYQHYGGQESRTNPCDTSSTTQIIQGGLPKGKIEADPDGAGPQTGRVSETVYNKSGATVATRYNNEPWTCTEYDSRGRITQAIIPAIGDKPARIITNNYAVDGNPLNTSTNDGSGTIKVENDLLGRTVKYTDAKGKVTEASYDHYGKLLSRTSPLGTEEYEYDNFDRATKYKLDGVTFATITYGALSRIQKIDYPAGMSLDPTIRDSLGRISKLTFTTAGETLSDEVTRSVFGKVLTSNENGVTKSYTYDKALRLTGANVAGNTYGYSFGQSDASCATVPGSNANAGKNGNRTKLTINGQVTTYCYDQADKLISSSDVRFTNAQYDARGNTVRLGDDTHKTEFTYDGSDRNTSITEQYADGQKKEVTYERDVQGRLTKRVYKVNDEVKGGNYYGYTSSGDSPDFLMDGNGDVTQKYISLPGGVKVTIKPQSTSAGAVTYSLSNFHGDTMATVNADGMVTGKSVSGPFGEKITGQQAPKNTAEGASWGYLGGAQKTTDVEFAIAPIQMGARVYASELGRFLQVDSVEGGTDNAYAYVNDPVNNYDLNGKWSIGGLFNSVVKAVAKVAKVVVATVKAVVHVAKVVAATVSYVARTYVAPVIYRAVTAVVNTAKAAGAAIASAAVAAYDGVSRASAAAFGKYGDALSLTATVVGIGVCAATAGLGCVAAAAAAVAIGAGVAWSQSYEKHGDAGRATAQMAGSLALDAVTLGAGRLISKAVGAGRIGAAAVDLQGAPFEFLGGMGVEAMIDDYYDTNSSTHGSGGW